MISIIIKEFLQFFRNKGLVIFILYAFTLDIYIAATGIKIKPQNIGVGILDYTNKGISTKIISHLHKPEFKKPIYFYNENELKKAIYNKKIMIGLIFDNDFDKTMHLKIIADATAASQAQMAIIYLQNILYNLLPKEKLRLDIASHKLFNQNSNTPWFMGLSEFMSVVTMIILILSAITFVKEKEKGTWDIMLLTPIDSKKIIFAKLLSQMLIISIFMVIAIGIIIFKVLNTPINGNLFLFFIASFIFFFALSGIGLFIASISNTILEVGQYSGIIMMPMIFLSGAWTPVYSMNIVNQFLAYFSPLYYYIEITQDIFFRGSEIYILIPKLLMLTLIGIVLFYLGYRKIGKLF
ncbi:ABC transporter permease [Caminibacter mediatlanticus TB-2]|uniref:ABC transporter permease n=1 Tax=Caminibacter mediatlanticus TB-2 TaxID=391592 RepID=A0ABX5V6V2_9BACT|nr:ABC transporter permease [Caminibacter mediatlanticus]QCT93978.1 ABC transporter permease [Caminibacter mediatlanticus TB-2]